MLKEETISVRKATCPWIAKADSKQRSAEAKELYPHLFENPVHIERIDSVVSILENFFKMNKGIYINHRANAGKKSFTTVKIASPIFPNNLNKEQKEKLYYEPLKKLGVEVKRNDVTNSLLFRIDC
jgi:hypothetical protein